MQGSRKTKGKREMAPAAEQQQPSPKGQAWFCTTGLPSDVVIEVGDMTFHLHKFPLMSKSKKIHDLITNRESSLVKQAGEAGQEEDAEAGEIREEEVVLEADEEADAHRIRLPDFPGGAEAFELAAKFCYGVKLDLTPATAAPLRCAAERLGMSDDHCEDNLLMRADRFISHTVLRNPRDAIPDILSFLPHLRSHIPPPLPTPSLKPPPPSSVPTRLRHILHSDQPRSNDPSFGQHLVQCHHSPCN